MDKQKRKRGKGIKPIPKRSRKGLFSPVQFAFTTPVSLEECVYRLEQENGSSWGLTSNVGAHVNLTEIDGDNYKFSIIGTSAEATGTMSRWEGTSTLLRGESQKSGCFGELVFLTILLVCLVYFFVILSFRSWSGIQDIILILLISGGLVHWNPYPSRLLNNIEAIVAPEPEKKKRAGWIGRVKVKRKR